MSGPATKTAEYILVVRRGHIERISSHVAQIKSLDAMLQSMKAGLTAEEWDNFMDECEAQDVDLVNTITDTAVVEAPAQATSPVTPYLPEDFDEQDFPDEIRYEMDPNCEGALREVSRQGRQERQGEEEKASGVIRPDRAYCSTCGAVFVQCTCPHS